ncbi:vesicle transport protein SEC20-like [Corticium candelabrum]|uniref:vesicle transport protein SEC20-like n=1 Tax=Corticium candelabrum TaxID=121492 RepID=UPI002E25BB8B|nr:vesicle transport protein SEC20-like [Corticium candelabrum]
MSEVHHIEELIRLEFEVRGIIEDLKVCRGPRERLTRLNAAAREKMKKVNGKCKLLERIAIEQDGVEDQKRIEATLLTHKEEASKLQIQLRKATLICEEAVQKAERDILLDAGSKEERESELRHRSRDSLVHSANNVTENLVHIREMMATSLDQSETTTEVLAGSSKTVSHAHEELKTFSSTVGTSRILVNKYNRREFTDRLLIFVGLLLFSSTVIFVVTRRLFPSMFQ